MKLDLTPVRQNYVVPTFGPEESTALDPQLEQRLRRPMRVGAAVIATFVVGLGAWASFTPIATGISAPAEIRVESNRKTMRARASGTVRQILVKEGQQVRAGQPLLRFDDVEARATYDVLQNQYDTLLATNVRFDAEATGKPTLAFPPELMGRMNDPRVATLVRDQQFLFSTRLSLFQSQAAVLRQRIDQLESQVSGQKAQIDSVNEQISLTNEELDGYKKLNEQGFAPKTLILRYQRSLADLGGRKGQLISDVARLRQQMGETRLQLVSLSNQRTNEAAEGLRDSQTKIAEVLPKLTAARQAFEATVLRSPVDGYVFNLTQFTPGGVIGAGEVMMDIVPAGAPLTVTAMIKPDDVDQVHVGQKARVRITALSSRWTPDLDATVMVVSRDRITNEKSGMSFYRVDLNIAPTELKKLKRGTELTSGMPAMALIVSGERTVMGFLISPITDSLKDAFRDE